MAAPTASNDVPTTTRALLQPDRASTRLTLTELPVPTPNPSSDEHLIRIHAASICAGELLWAQLYPHPSLSLKEAIPCTDFAGTVMTAPSTSPFRPGDAVYARTHYGRPGNARDYTIAQTSELAHAPLRLSWTEAAAVPVSAETAWQALFVQAGLPPPRNLHPEPSLAGTRILVTAASGSVGAWAVQLAHAYGAHVVGTCGPRNLDFVRSLGAAEVLDYTTVDVRAWGAAADPKIDVVVDCSTSSKSLADTWFCVKDGGVLLSIYQPPETVRPAEEESIAKNVRHAFFIMQSDGSQLEKVSALLESGACRPVVDSVWPLQRYEQAFARVGAGHCRGKVVFDMDLRG